MAAKYPVNINNCSIEELKLISGVGPAYALEIWKMRVKYNECISYEDIDDVADSVLRKRLKQALKNGEACLMSDDEEESRASVDEISLRAEAELDKIVTSMKHSRSRTLSDNATNSDDKSSDILVARGQKATSKENVPVSGKPPITMQGQRGWKCQPEVPPMQLGPNHVQFRVDEAAQQGTNPAFPGQHPYGIIPEVSQSHKVGQMWNPFVYGMWPGVWGCTNCGHQMAITSINPQTEQSTVPTGRLTRDDADNHRGDGHRRKKERVSTRDKKQRFSSSSSSSSCSSSSSSSCDSSSCSRVRYSKSDRIPSFDGTIRWRAYYLQFKSITAGQTKGVKRNLLLRALKGQPLEFVSSLSRKDKRSWSRLKEKLAKRYDRILPASSARQVCSLLKQSEEESLMDFGARVTEHGHTKSHPQAK